MAEVEAEAEINLRCVNVSEVVKLETRSIAVVVKEVMDGIVRQFPGQTVVIKKVVINIHHNACEGGGSAINFGDEAIKNHYENSV